MKSSAIALAFLLALAATASAQCPERISYFSESELLKRLGSECVFSWDVESFASRWPVVLDLGKELRWQKTEASLRRCLFPQSTFHATIDSVLSVAKAHDLSVGVAKKGKLTYIIIMGCLLSSIICVGEDGKATNVDIDYGELDGYIRRVRPICSGTGCAPGEMRKLISATDVVGQIRILAEDYENVRSSACLARPTASPLLKPRHERQEEGPDEQARKEDEKWMVESILRERWDKPWFMDSTISLEGVLF